MESSLSDPSTVLTLYDESWSTTSSTTNASYTVDSDNIPTETLGIVSDSDGNNEYPWKIKKRMTRSDLRKCRLLVQTNLVRRHILPFFGTNSLIEIESKNGMRVRVWDQDKECEHELVFKKRPTSSRSYVFIGKWYKDFVKRRELKVGDLIGLYWDSRNSRFNFCVIQLKDLLGTMEF